MEAPTADCNHLPANGLTLPRQSAMLERIDAPPVDYRRPMLSAE